MVFFDDILVYNTGLETHWDHLCTVISTLRAYQLKVKLSKCSFAQQPVQYLGHTIFDQGVAVDDSKIARIREWPTPTNVKSLRSFLRLAGYYRRFVKRFGTIAKPLTDLLKSNGFHWSNEADMAFHALKRALISTHVLALPDFSQPFIIESDASDGGIGDVLSQGKHPIAFISRALAPRHCVLLVYDKEMLAIVYVVQQWRPYLLGRQFRIITDH